MRKSQKESWDTYRTTTRFITMGVCTAFLVQECVSVDASYGQVSAKADCTWSKLASLS